MTPSGCKDKGVRIFEFVSLTQFSCKKHEYFQSQPKAQVSESSRINKSCPRTITDQSLKACLQK